MRSPRRKTPTRSTPGAVPLATAVLLAAAFAGLAWAPPLQGQEPQPQPQETIEVDEPELVAFTRAHLEVVEIQEALEAQMQQAETAEEAQAFQELANQAMIQAIETEDLTRDRFVEIASAINTDPELRQRFQAVQERLLQEREEAEPPSGG